MLSNSLEGTGTAPDDNSGKWLISEQGATNTTTSPQWQVPGEGVQEVEFQMGFGAEDHVGDFDFDDSALLYLT